jgi:hypothetical protein
MHCTAVCCGHTHHAMCDGTLEVPYYNSGCWTELPCTFLAVHDGRIELHSFDGASTAPALEDTSWRESSAAPLDLPPVQREVVG